MAKTGTFPTGFLWGTATAAHQVEGNNRHNDFWSWEVKHARIPNSADACKHYELYKTDFALIKEVLHNNSHRLSIEWSRIEPQEGRFNKKEIAHYREVFSELARLGIKPLVTLHHFTNPKWFLDLGGWEKRKNVHFFERFCSLVVKEYGDLVTDWVIINEPNVYVALAYLRGFWPPSKRNPIKAIRVFLNLAYAHRRVYRVIHRVSPQAQVGSAINMAFFKGGNSLEKTIARLFTTIVNYSFTYLTAGSNDYLGINYYFYRPIVLSHLIPTKRVGRKDFLDAVYGKRSDLGWVVYPQGIYEVCKAAWAKFGLPIVITENGVADKTDLIRQRYVVDSLTWLLQAQGEGVNILGYFHWALLDNIEWGLGKKARFGLIKTHYKNQQRSPRKSATIYGRICKENGLTSFY